MSHQTEYRHQALQAFTSSFERSTRDLSASVIDLPLDQRKEIQNLVAELWLTFKAHGPLFASPCGQTSDTYKRN